MNTTKCRARSEWESLVDDGLCPECKQREPCRPPCRKFWFDYGYNKGFHDGANNLVHHDHAFVVEMIEWGEYSNGDDES